jgi:hypothetical protein
MTTEARRYRHWLKLWERLQDPVTTERFSRLFHKWDTEPANPSDFPYDDRLRCKTCGAVFTSMTVRDWGRCPMGCRPKTDAEVALELMEQLYRQRTSMP